MDMRFRRRCRAKVALTGEDCRQAPLREKDYCFWHDPENAEAAQEARRLGQQRAKREGSVAAAMQVDGLASVPDLRRILEIVLFDTLALQNGVPATACSSRSSRRGHRSSRMASSSSGWTRRRACSGTAQKKPGGTR
ncbi:MAG: hypothetical protein M5U18_08335 [Dehalococcoidia bacterium]|nr:hypothetical protein [Dehalococcoidia bacterium]